MKANTLLISAAILLAIVGMIVVVNSQPDSRRGSVKPATLRDWEENQAGSVLEGEQSSERLLLPASREPSQENERVPVVFGDESALRGRVLDPNGLPLSEVHLTVRRNLLRPFRRLHSKVAIEAIVVAEADTNELGEFSFPLDPGRVYALSAVAAGFASTVRFDTYAGELITLHLNLESIFIGRVLGLSRSQALSARVRGCQIGNETEWLFDVQTDSDGAFRIEGLDAMEIRVEFIPKTASRPRPLFLKTVPGHTHQIDIVCDSRIYYRGTVKDAITGEPVVGARVSNDAGFEPAVITNRRGRYKFPSYSAQTIDVLEVRAEGYGTVRRSNREAYRPPESFDFELVPGRSTSGLLLDLNGKAVVDALVIAIGASTRTDSQETELRTTRTSARGRFQFSDLTARLSHALLIISEGHASVVYDFPENEEHLTTIALRTIRLQPPTLLRGIVLLANGNVAVRQKVKLLGANEDRDRFGGLPSDEINSICAERTCFTDHRGRFAFSDLAPGAYELQVSQSDYSKPRIREVHISGNENVQDVRLKANF